MHKLMWRFLTTTKKKKIPDRNLDTACLRAFRVITKTFANEHHSCLSTPFGNTCTINVGGTNLHIMAVVYGKLNCASPIFSFSLVDFSFKSGNLNGRQGCQLSRIIRESPDFEPYLPVSRFMSVMSRF